MDTFFSRYKNALVLVLILLAQTLGLAVQVQRPQSRLSILTGPGAGPQGLSSDADRRGVSLLRFWAAALLTPFERVAHHSLLDLRHLWGNYVYLRYTREQNATLQSEIARLRLEQAAFAEDAAQGRRLQSLLAFKQQYISSTVAAQIIGTSGSDRSRVVYIDKGSADGLKPQMPVITPDGVVGKLREVFPHSAQLLLLNDLTSGAGVTLVSTRMRAILQGAPGGRISINDLTPDERIHPGEHVVTSGGDLVFPRGLPVGVIQSIAPDPEHQPYTAIVVQPFANLARLEEVLVITGLSQKLSVEAQHDAEQASATADDMRRAADILAQRLPGLDKPPQAAPGAQGGAVATVASKAASGSKPGVPASKPGASGSAGTVAAPDPNAADRGGLPGIPNSGLPHVQPAAHPDRYSPGAAPPAADLKPGGGPG